MSNTVVCIGDSLTYGKSWGFNSDLQMPLNSRLAQRYPGISVVNLGVNGEVSDDLYTRRAAVNVYDPFRVIVWIGINDISTGVSAATLQTNLQNIFTYYKSTKGYEVFALTITPVDTESGAQNTIRSTVNAWIKNTATGVDRVIDAFTVVADPLDTTKRKSAYADPNTASHVNDAGIAAIVDLFP